MHFLTDSTMYPNSSHRCLPFSERMLTSLLQNIGSPFSYEIIFEGPSSILSISINLQYQIIYSHETIRESQNTTFFRVKNRIKIRKKHKIFHCPIYQPSLHSSWRDPSYSCVLIHMTTNSISAPSKELRPAMTMDAFFEERNHMYKDQGASGWLLLF